MKAKKNQVSSDYVLVTVKGPDRPGITAALTGILSRGNGVTLIDVEQIVVHRKLILSLLLAFDRRANHQSEVLKELLFEAKRLDVGLDFEAFDPAL